MRNIDNTLLIIVFECWRERLSPQVHAHAPSSQLTCIAGPLSALPARERVSYVAVHAFVCMLIMFCSLMSSHSRCPRAAARTIQATHAYAHTDACAHTHGAPSGTTHKCTIVQDIGGARAELGVFSSFAQYSYFRCAFLLRYSGALRHSTVRGATLKSRTVTVVSYHVTREFPSSTPIKCCLRRSRCPEVHNNIKDKTQTKIAVLGVLSNYVRADRRVTNERVCRAHPSQETHVIATWRISQAKRADSSP